MTTREVKTEPVPIRNPEFLGRLDQLAKEAGHICQDADLVARSTAAKTTAAKKPIEETTVNDYLSELSSDRVLWVACGVFPIPHSSHRLTLFWDSVRTLVAAQFSGFPAGSQDSITNILYKLGPPSRRYWNPLALPTKSDSSCVFARLFALLSLCSAALPRLQELEPLRRTAALSDVTKLLVTVVMHYVPSLQEAHPDHVLWPVTLLKLAKNIYQMMLKLYREQLAEEALKHRIEDFEKCRPLKLEKELRELEAKLRNQLKINLDSGRLSPLEVSDTVGVLGGRYLNPALQIEPVDIALYTRATGYVLANRKRLDGSWDIDYRHKKYPELADPLFGRYSPLPFLLDLPNAVLMPCITDLVDAAAEALSTLKRRLAGYKVQLPESKNEIGDVVKDVYNGLMVGAAVSDRLKDLLSDAELDQLGAEVPEKAVEWDQLSDSLGFKDNLQHGVIQLWKTRNPSRPGAILVFGPPGTGKTTIAKALLAKLNRELEGMPGPNDNWRFLALSPADFAREGSTHVIALAEQMFQRLQRVRRCVVLLDEMEEFLRARGPEAGRESSLVTTAFLPLLQETVNRREIILIVATNFVGNIDPAVTRRGRFDLILPLGPPDSESRRTIVLAELGLLSDRLSRKDIKQIVKHTMGYTRDEIRDYLKELTRPAEFPKDSALVCELWRIRQERVPMALSGKPGCNWRTFRDEAARFKRPAAGTDSLESSGRNSAKETKKRKERKSSQDYWIEPELPKV